MTYGPMAKPRSGDKAGGAELPLPIGPRGKWVAQPPTRRSPFGRGQERHSGEPPSSSLKGSGSGLMLIESRPFRTNTPIMVHSQVIGRTRRESDLQIQSESNKSQRSQKAELKGNGSVRCP